MDESAFDYLIVGSGAGGSAAAFRLAQTGRSVLLLEKGGELPEDGSTLDPAVVLGEGRFKSRERWHGSNGHWLAPEEFFNLGGKTRWYGAALLRYDEREFQQDEARGFLPWPVSYAELLPYYRQAETLLGVRAFAIEPDLERIVGRLEQQMAGWRSEPIALGLSPDILSHPLAATRFDGFAVPGGLKADARHRLLDRVRDRPNLRVETGAEVVELVTGAGMPQRITGVRCADGRRFMADTVLVAGGALHSPRLLQRYFESTGLAARLPSYGQLGRNYKRHVLSAVLGFAPVPQRDLLRKTTLILNERFPHSSVQPLGGWVDREIVNTLLPGFVPAALRRFFAERVYGFFLQTEDGSDARNRVRADAGDGLPQLDYALERLPHAASEHRALVRHFCRSLLRAGLLPVSKRIPLDGSAHSLGTLVAGDDVRRSVVCGDGRVHGLENVYVVDGSVLPRAGRLNPALTIYAWSLRVCDRLAMALTPSETGAA